MLFNDCSFNVSLIFDTTSLIHNWMVLYLLMKRITMEKHNMNLLSVFVFIGLAVSVAGWHRSRRQTPGFIVLLNESLPCTELSSSHPELERVDLTDEEKLHIMMKNNVQLIKTFQAVTQEEAISDFPSLIPLEKIYEDHITEQSTLPKHGPYKITKRNIIDYMVNLYKMTDPRNDEPNKEDRDGDWNNKNQTHISTDGYTEDKDFLHYLEEIKLVKDVEKRMSSWRNWMKGRFTEENANFPLYFPEMLGIPEKISLPNGRTVQMEFCQDRGGVTQDLNVRLCTVCSATTTNPQDTWPAYMNEAVCSKDDSGCLFVEQTSHGSCRQVTAPLNMLKKRNEECTLILRDDQTLIADHWDVFTDVVNVGCECNVKPGSFFEDFV